MANTDNPFGFKLLTPYKPQYMQYYPVVTAYATSVFKGDLVGGAAATTGYVCRALDGSTRPGLEVVTAGVAGETFGVVMGTYDHNLLPIVYFVAGSAGDGVVGGYLLVNTDPDALYLVQEDGDTTPIAAASAALNCDAISTHTGNTLTGRSKMELDSDSVADTATLALKLIRSFEADEVDSAWCRYIVKVNSAAMGDNIVGPA